MNRYGEIRNGHYEPWLTQHINGWRVQLRSLAIYNEPGLHNHAALVESYGISTLPQSLMNLYNIKPARNLITSTNKNTTSFDLAILVILHGSSAHTAGTQYKFIAQRQKATHAILPVQTEDERNKYYLLLRQSFLQQVQRDQLPDFDKIGKIWSTFVDGKTILYKAPEYLRNYHSEWNEYQNISKTRKVIKRL